MLFLVMIYAIPLLILGLWGFSLWCYLSGKKKNKVNPGTVSEGQMKERRLFLILSSVIALALVIAVVGFISLIYMSVAFM